MSNNGGTSPAAPAGAPPSTSPMQYNLNNRMMIAAIVVLLVVVFFVLTLHVYAKWFWRGSTRRRSVSWRRRGRFDFTGEEHNTAGRAVGLDRSIIDSLPVFSYKAPPSAEEPLLECAVCLCEFEENEKGRRLPACKHSFHIDCIDMWFHSHRTCPLCRTVVTADFDTCAPIPAPIEQSDTPQQGSAVPPRLGMHHPSLSAPTLPYPNNILFWGDHNHVRSQLGSPRLGSEASSSTRSLPHVSIEIPRRTENFVTPRCLSLSLSRIPSEDNEHGCSFQPLKSPSIRMSIKRLLSRERSRGRSRGMSTGGGAQDHGDANEETAFANLHVAS
ncbi:hypothetical protein KP509_39G005300 [Ceratopteris richardii]|uniref:RING-type E3 ubiquitin transferase n=1 Tax=Ceratopteris richardii TaxID=49495 RepID=A0A8T2PXN7_CERRI|nr:hypothetical protein KP509_39G005300 [Ceratopteris richardii]